MILRRASRYSLLVFTDGRHWRRLLTISRQSGTTDALSFPPVTVKYVRLQILAATAKQPPLLQELTVTGGAGPGKVRSSAAGGDEGSAAGGGEGPRLGVTKVRGWG